MEYLTHIIPSLYYKSCHYVLALSAVDLVGKTIAYLVSDLKNEDITGFQLRHLQECGKVAVSPST